MSEGAVRAEAAAAALAQPEIPSSRVRAASELLPRRPYPGLRPFEKAEWPIFRGRDRLVQDILTLLAESHFASVIGPSGSGKSSLVRAGVLATLERRHSRMGVRWQTGIMRPGVSPLWSMAEGILRALRPEMVASDGELPAAEVARLRVLIDTSEDGLGALTREFELKEHENFLLLVDQFEEMVEQSAQHPLVCNISIHPYVFGYPFRLRPLRKALRHCFSSAFMDRVWKCKPEDIADYCYALKPGIVPGSGK